MSRRSKWIMLLIGMLVLWQLVSWGYIEWFRKIGFEEARQMADKRFQAYAEGYHLRPTDFGPPRIEDRGNEWLFDWHALKGEGEIIVIVRRNGEIFDGGDGRLEPRDKR